MYSWLFISIKSIISILQLSLVIIKEYFLSITIIFIAAIIEFYLALSQLIN